MAKTKIKIKEKKMDRIELIYALRKYMRGDQYQKILKWSTENIESLYQHYQTV